MNLEVSYPPQKEKSTVYSDFFKTVFAIIVVPTRQEMKKKMIYGTEIEFAKIKLKFRIVDHILFTCLRDKNAYL